MKKAIPISIALIICLIAIWSISQRKAPAVTEAFLSYGSPGTYGPNRDSQTITGDLTLKSSGIKLQNTHITGNLYLENIPGGIVQLSNTTVDGTVAVIGGQSFSLFMKDCLINSVSITSTEEEMRLVVEGSTTIYNLRTQGCVRLEEQYLTGNGLHQISINSSHQVVISGDIYTINIHATGAQITLESGTVDHLTVEDTATNTTIMIGEDATVKAMVLNATNCHLSIAPDNLTVAEGVTYTTGDKAEPTPADIESPIIIYPVRPLTLTVGESATLSLTAQPSSAEFTASSGNTGVAQVSVISSTLTVNGVSPGTARITLAASHPDYSGASIVFTVTVVLPKAAAPFASPSPGEVPSGTAITLSSPTPGSTIHYTIDGSTPTINSPIYNQNAKPTITSDFTIKAIAVKDNMTSSDIAIWTYFVRNEQQPEEPTEPEA